MEGGTFDDNDGGDDVQGEFICPECGSGTIGDHLLVSPAMTDDENPWSVVTQRIRCGYCRSWVPAHLGQRWGGMSLDRAKEEWHESFRDGGISQARREREARYAGRRRTKNGEDGSDY